MTVLRSRGCWKPRSREENAKYAAHRKQQVGTGEPERKDPDVVEFSAEPRVTDHRIAR